MTIVVTWAGVLLGVLGTIFAEGIALVAYAVYCNIETEKKK